MKEKIYLKCHHPKITTKIFMFVSRHLYISKKKKYILQPAFAEEHTEHFFVKISQVRQKHRPDISMPLSLGSRSYRPSTKRVPHSRAILTLREAHYKKNAR